MMTTDAMPLYSCAMVRNFEKMAVNQFNISESQMMATAGAGAFALLIKTWPRVRSIAVFCGPGNNGGDGYVVAKLAKQQGLAVKLWQVGDTTRASQSALGALGACRMAGVMMASYHSLATIEEEVIVDALLGIGLQGEVRDNYVAAIEKINRSKIPVLAIDIPSGLDADTGKVLGHAVKATQTITFIGYKPGLVTGDAREYCGEIHCDDLQLPPALFAQTKPVAMVSDFSLLQKVLGKRCRVAHKGDYGHVLIIGGDNGMAGAVALAGSAALRVGAGVVTVATRAEHVAMVTGFRPELMVHGIHKDHDLMPLLHKATVVIIGPGLGQSDWSHALFIATMNCSKPLVVDADGLNLLAQTAMRREEWVLTPHPGEALRLLGTCKMADKQNRYQMVQVLREKYGGCVVLKGAGTVINFADEPIKVCPYGDPGMAAPGMGDVLSGVIGGLMAQKIPLAVAAELGVCVHGLAGDEASAAGERGMCAADLLPVLRKLVNP